MDRVLHCYAIGRDGAWEAVCLDLDLAVQGRSFDEVNASLAQAIALHLEGVMALPENERARLLNRSVPFLTRLRFAWDAFLMSFRTRTDDGYRHQFTMPLPA
jgi:predicted RNase H-like HicB family nuclease